MFQSGCLYKLIWAQILVFFHYGIVARIHLGDKKIVTWTKGSMQPKLKLEVVEQEFCERRLQEGNVPFLFRVFDQQAAHPWCNFLHFVYKKKTASAKQVSLHPGLGLIVPHCNILTLICSPYLFVIRKLWRGQDAVGHVEVRSHFRFGQGVVDDQERGLKTRPWLVGRWRSSNYFRLGFFVPEPRAYFCVRLTDDMARIYLDEFS